MERYSEKLLLRFGDNYGTMVVHVWSPPISSATVFCIHSFTGNGNDFDYLAAFLVQKGFTVVCPDMIGRGESTYFGDPAMYSSATYFTCLGALSKYGGNTIHFIGTSWGGSLIMRFLHANRFKVDKLVLNDVGMRDNPSIDHAIRVIMEDATQEFDAVEEAQTYIRRTRTLGELPEDLLSRLLERTIRFSDGKFRLAYDPATAGEVLPLLERQFDIFPLLETLQAKILLFYAAESKCYEPETVADLMRRLPNISCIPNLRSGHPPSLMTYDQALMIGGFLSL